MFDNMFGMFDDFDASKVKDVVETVWDDREKITTSAHLVWENKDQIVNVIEFFQEHQDAIVTFLQRLPELLGTTGEGIIAAGEGALNASGLLTGSDDDEMSAQRLAEVAAEALDTLCGQMGSVVDLVGAIGRQVDRLGIPTVEPKYTEVMGFNVVTGIEFGEASLLDEAVSTLESGADTLGSMESSLTEIASQLRHLGARLTEAGSNLDHVGTKLQESGGVLKEVATLTG